MPETETKRVCVKCGGVGHLAAWKLKNGSTSFCRTFNILPDAIAVQMKYPWLGNRSLKDIRALVAKKSKGDGAVAAFLDVSKLVDEADNSRQASSSTDDSEKDAVNAFMTGVSLDDEGEAESDNETKDDDDGSEQ